MKQLKQLLLVMAIALTGFTPAQAQTPTTFTHYSEWMAYARRNLVYNKSDKDYQSSGDWWRYDDGLMYESILDTYEHYKNGGGDFSDETLKNVAFWYIDNCFDGNDIKNYATKELDDIRPARLLYKYYSRYENSGTTLGNKLLNACQTVMNCQAFNDDVRVISQSTGYPWQHKGDYAHQVWLDGIFMGIPYWTLAGPNGIKPNTNNNNKTSWTANDFFDDAISQMLKTDEKTYEPTIGLWCHAWDEYYGTSNTPQYWSTKKSSFLTNDFHTAKKHSPYELIPHDGRSSHCWGRALGWYAMAIMETMDNIRAKNGVSDSRITTLKALFKKVMDKVVETRDPSAGVWHCVIDVDATQAPYKDYSTKNNYLEATCSAMFTYCLLHGVAQGYLDSSYLPVAKDSYNKLISNFITTNDGLKLNDCMQVGGLGPNSDSKRDGSYAYYMSESIISNDSKGVGPFIWASLEAEKTYGYTITGGFSTPVASDDIVQFRWSRVADDFTVPNTTPASYVSPTFTAKTSGGTPLTNNTDITFVSDNTAVATVDANGTITLAGEAGTANIKATMKSGAGAYVGEAIYTVTTTGTDTTKPTLSSSTPATNATDVALSGNIVLTFSEAVTIADASKITLIGGAGTLDKEHATTDGATITIPYSGLANSTPYTLNIDAGAVKDLSENTNEAISAITFRTIAPDLTAPMLSNQSISDGDTNVSTSGSIVLTFSEDVACTTNATLTPVGGGTTINLTPTVSGTTVTYSYSGLSNSTSYTFNLADNSVADLADNKYTSAISFSFTTGASNAAQTFSLPTTIDFTNSAWSGKTFSQGNTTNADIVNGITFYAKSSSNQFSINSSTQYLKFPNSNMSSSNYYLGIALSGINSKITVTITFAGVASGKTGKINVKLVGNTTSFSTSLGNTGSAYQPTTTGDTTFSFDLDCSDQTAMLYIGRGNSDTPGISSITITTASSTPSKVATPEITGTTPFSSSTTATIGCDTPEATIHYTIDGSTPTSSSATYSEPINISATTIVKAIAVKEGMTNSEVASKTFTQDNTAPTVTMATPSATTDVAINTSSVVLTVSEDITAVGGTIAGTFDGNAITFTRTNATTLTYSIPSTLTNSKTYNVTLSANQIQDAAGNKNAEKSFSFTTEAAEQEQVATPSISGNTSFTESTTATITCATTGATIHYTLDDTAPTASSTTYSSPIAISATTTIKAIAIKSGMTDSEVASATFTKSGGGGSSTTISIFDGTTDSAKASSSTHYKTDTEYTDATTGFKYTCYTVKDYLVDASSYTKDTSVTKTYTKALQQNGSTINATSNHFKLVVPTGYTASVFVAYACTSSAPKYCGIHTSPQQPNGSNCSTWNATIPSNNNTKFYGATISNLAAGTYYLMGNSGNNVFGEITVTLTPTGTPSPTTYTVTATSNNNSWGTVSVDKATAAKGATVTITTTPASGYELTSLTATDGESNPMTITNNQFNMPASDVTVNATFAAISPVLGDVTFSPAGGNYSSEQNVTISATNAEEIWYSTVSQAAAVKNGANATQYTSAIHIGEGSTTLYATAYLGESTTTGNANYTVTIPDVGNGTELYTFSMSGSTINFANGDTENFSITNNKSCQFESPDKIKFRWHASNNEYGQFTLTSKKGIPIQSVKLVATIEGDDKSSWGETETVHQNVAVTNGTYDPETMTWTANSDDVTSVTFTNNYDATYNGNIYISKIIVVYYAPETITIAEAGFSTLYKTYAVSVGDGGTAYYVSDIQNKNVVLTPFTNNIIPANTGAVIKGTFGDEVTLNRAIADNFTATNYLLGTDTKRNITAEKDRYYYFISGRQKQADNSYKYGWLVPNALKTTSVFSNNANKAYLQIPKSMLDSETAARMLTLVWEDYEQPIATGIDGFATDNGFIVIDDNTPLYNLSGQRVSKSYKGIVIVNGKKVLRK